MNNTKRLLVILVCFVLVLIGAWLLYARLGANTPTGQVVPQGAGNTPQEEEDPVLTPAPDVTFYDADGGAHKLSDYYGKPLVLNFWASWCEPCKMEMPDFEEKYQALGDQVQFLMVNMTTSYRESFENAAAHVADQGYTFPVFYDTDGTVMETYGVTSFPTTYFLDADGNLVARAGGAISGELLQQGIDMISE